jgi:hypothetical protein
LTANRLQPMIAARGGHLCERQRFL